MLRVVVCMLALFPVTVRADPPPKPVRVQTVQYAPAAEAVTYSGTVQPRVQASLGFRIAGQVTERTVDIGDQVMPGQTLARLDPVDLRLSLESSAQALRAAEATAANARADFHRYERLGRGSPAWLPSEFDRRQAAFDSAEARLAQAQRQLALARSQLDYATLKADTAGVITDLRLEVGQVIAAGQTVITLAHTAETEIVIDVPENRLPEIRAARSIGITLWSQPDVTLTGRLREIGALADPASRTFAVKITVIDPPEGALRLGMTAAVRFDHDPTPVVRLPASAVVSVNGTPSVWVLDPATHRASAHPVQVSTWRGDGEVAITAGVPAGSRVVTAGASQLDASTPVVAWVGAFR